MKKMLQAVPLLLMIIGTVLVFERPAYGYTDPGTGLLAIQAFGSALVAAGWYLRRKIYALVHRGTPSRQETEIYPSTKDGEGSPLS